MKLNPDFYKGKKVLVTGHTGFKGSYMCVLLKYLGAKTYGYSLKPEKGSLYELMSKDAKKSLPNAKVRFFETYPKIEPNHFIVTDMDNNSVTFYKMIIC